MMFVDFIIALINQYGGEVATAVIALLIRWLEKKKMKQRTSAKREQLEQTIDQLRERLSKKV